MNGSYNYKGFSFDTREELELAKKEDEAIEYLKAKTNTNDPEVVLKLYNKLLDRNMFVTPVGTKFLLDMKKYILESGIIDESRLKRIPADQKRRPETKKTKENKLIKENIYLKITVFIMSLLIIAMFIIALTGKMSPAASVYEMQIRDKYAKWAEQLSDKEEELRNVVRFLKEMGYNVDFEELTEYGE